MFKTILHRMGGFGDLKRCRPKHGPTNKIRTQTQSLHSSPIQRLIMPQFNMHFVIRSKLAYLNTGKCYDQCHSARIYTENSDYISVFTGNEQMEEKRFATLCLNSMDFQK